MTPDFIITDEMKEAEAKRWKERCAKVKCTIKHEINEAADPKFINKDIPSPLRAFAKSEAANAAVEATEE